MRGSLAIVGVFGLLVGLATFFVVTLQREEIIASRDEFDRYKIDAGKELTAAREEARVAAAQANADIAKAHENTAALEKEAAVARAEQERLKLLVTWRTIPAGMRRDLVARLSTRKAVIKLAVTMNDPEAQFFGSQITSIFAEAGWEAIPHPIQYGRFLVIGLHIPPPDTETVRFLRDTFSAVGLHFFADPFPTPPDFQIEFEKEKPTTGMVLIGSKIGPVP